MAKQVLHRFSVSRFSLLNEAGVLDPSYKLTLTALQLKKIFQQMCFVRSFDEKAVRYQRQGRLGTFAASTGQEAIQIGTAAALSDQDWVAPSFREPGLYFWRGISAKTLFLFFMGSEWGNVFPKEKRLLPYSVPCASQTLHAVGLAMAAKIKKEAACVVTYLGDGASSEGDFHEALNFASVFQAPVLFICQNNHWAISTSPKQQYHGQTLAQRAIGYGMPGLQVDGNDVLAVYEATREALNHAREGHGPTFLECETYRLAPHTTNDNPELYRDPSELKLWQVRDPLIRFEKYLLGCGLLKPGEKEKMQEWMDHQLKAQMEAAEMECSQRSPLEMLDFVYQEIPQRIKEQQQDLLESLKPTPKQDLPNLEEENS